MIVSNEEIPKCFHVVTQPEVLTRRIIFVRDAFFSTRCENLPSEDGFCNRLSPMKSPTRDGKAFCSRPSVCS